MPEHMIFSLVGKKTMHTNSIKRLTIDYSYYLHANSAAVKYLLGTPDEAIKEFEYCKEPPILMKATEKTYLKKRYKIWQEVYRENTSIPREEFNTYMTDKLSGGSALDFIGRAFLGSDIQFWTEA